jgi:hypothetical protein
MANESCRERRERVACTPHVRLGRLRADQRGVYTIEVRSAGCRSLVDATGADAPGLDFALFQRGRTTVVAAATSLTLLHGARRDTPDPGLW